MLFLNQLKDFDNRDHTRIGQQTFVFVIVIFVSCINGTGIPCAIVGLFIPVFNICVPICKQSVVSPSIILPHKKVGACIVT